MELGFLNLSNDIISGDLDKIPPNHGKVLGEIEPKKKRNDYVTEISENDVKDIYVDANRNYYVCAQYREHEGFENNKPHLEENLPQED